MTLLTPLSPHNSISHFANLHGTGGGGYDPPRVWLLSELFIYLFIYTYNDIHNKNGGY